MHVCPTTCLPPPPADLWSDVAALRNVLRLGSRCLFFPRPFWRRTARRHPLTAVQLECLQFCNEHGGVLVNRRGRRWSAPGTGRDARTFLDSTVLALIRRGDLEVTHHQDRPHGRPLRVRLQEVANPWA